MQNFSYHAPASLEEAFAVKGEHPETSRYLAGGTDLLLAMEWGQDHVTAVIDLKGIAGLAEIELLPDGRWRIGALTPMARIEAHPELTAAFPALTEAAAVVGGPPIRNRATLGGNLCNASPAADTAIPLLALGAEAVLASASGERTLPLGEFWTGPRATVLQPGELLKAVHLPAPPPRSASAFARLTRTAMDIAVVNAAAAITLDEQGAFAKVACALGAVGPVVLPVPAMEQALRGKACNDETLAEAASLAESAAQPIDDRRASAEYRREMAGVLAARALRRAHERATEGARA